MNPYTALYIALPVIYSVYALSTLFLHFWHFAPKVDVQRPRLMHMFRIALYDKNSELNKRSSMLGAFLSLTIAGWLEISGRFVHEWHFDCGVSITLTLAAWPWMILSFIFRIVRVRAMVEISRLRRMASLLGSESTFASANSEDMTGSLMKSNVGIAQSWTSTSLTIPPELPNSNKELDEEALLLIQLSRLEFWIDEQRLILISFFGGIGVLILNMLVSIPFGWYAKFNENFGCTWGDHYYMNLAVVGLYVFVGLPFCIYIMRDSADAYFLSRSIWLILMVSPPLYLTFIGLSFADPTVEINHIFPAYNVGIISLIINHTGTIVIPLLNDMFKMQTEQEKLASYSGFVHTLGKDMLYDQLKDCIMEAFSAENGMFWDSFVSWMTRCLHQFFGASDKVHRDAMTMLLTANAFQDSDVLKSEVIKSSSQFIQFLASNQKVVTVKGISAIEVPMPYSVAKGLCLIYQRFLKEEAPFELNLPKATRDAISPTLLVLEEAVADLENQLEAAPNSRHQKSKAVLAGVLLSFIPMAPDDLPKLDRNELIVPITILDDVKIAVLAMIYQNSYPRYLKKQATSHV